MNNWKLTVEYNGAGFCGWQSQPEKCGVQDAIEAAIERIDCGFKRVVVAGRTDAGVQATGQVCSLKLEKKWTSHKLIEAMNAHLRQIGRVSVLDAQSVPDDFDARFSAKRRHYLYITQNRRAPLTHLKGLCWVIPFKINLETMRAGAKTLLGKHDFTTFRDLQCQAESPIKTLDRFDIDEIETPFGTQIHFNLNAPSFLHRQVRSMVGTMIDVGRGRFTIEQLTQALEAKDRTRCGGVAPPDGLYLKQIDY